MFYQPQVGFKWLVKPLVANLYHSPHEKLFNPATFIVEMSEDLNL